MGFWNQPSSVPECLLSSLQILNWEGYFGRPQDRDIAVYILRNARHLRTATFWADTNEHDVPNLEMIKGLTLSSRASSTCELVFVEDSWNLNHYMSFHLCNRILIWYVIVCVRVLLLTEDIVFHLFSCVRVQQWSDCSYIIIKLMQSMNICLGQKVLLTWTLGVA